MTEIAVRVESVAVGNKKSSLLKKAVQSLELSLEGIVGDKHAGFIKPADGRDSGIARGEPVRNWRQWSAVSVEELKRIADALGVAELDPALLGANVTFSGYDNLSLIPKGSMIWFPSGAVLSVEGENEPCMGPGREIARVFPHVQAALFPKAAKNLRGLVGVVYRPGAIAVGDQAVIRTCQPHEAMPPPPLRARR